MNWDQSRQNLERAKRSLAGGVSSPFRVKAPVPLYFRNGRGARLEDVDGNEYIDYCLAWGPMILGYRHPAIVAAVVMEPVLCNSGCILPRPGYLEQARRVCTERGILLIFDEVITGFRLSLGGAQEHYGVVPDVATFGKAVAGGAPLSGIAGRADILMQMYNGVAFGGSFNGNPVSLASANATLTELARDDGAALVHANRMGQRLMDGIPRMARVPVLVSGFGAAFAIHFTHQTELRDYRDTLTDDTGLLRRFLYRALEQ